MSLTYGEMFAGYGGLGMGVQSVLGGEMKWCAEFDAAPSKILAHHWPDVPNLGDVTKVDWASVPKVDVITGGSPCQDLSHAGKRAGMKAGTRSGLWASMCDAIEIIRPRLVVWENVRGALSAEADSALEQCSGCMGDGGTRGPVLRALGRVLGDLADLGYDASWYGLRAADVGAPHGRFRIFVFATDSDSLRGERPGTAWGGRAGLADDSLTPANTEGHEQREPADASEWRGGLRTEPWDGSVTPPDANSAGRLEHSGPITTEPEQPAAQHACDLVPNPAGDGRDKGWTEPARLVGGPDAAERGDAPPADAGSERHGRGQDRRALGRVDGGDAGQTRQRERAREVAGDRGATDWGQYAPAINRWESVLGRPAPAPTEPGPKGGQRLSPRFVEFLMGLPEGHVTDVEISRNDMLKALGNGVVPQQAAAATRAWLSHIESEAVA